MQGEIISRSALRIIGLGVPGPEEELGEKAPAAWNELVRREEEIRRPVDLNVQYGIVPPQERRFRRDGPVYFIGQEVREFGIVPPGMVALLIAPRTYAVFHYEGSFLSKEWERFYPETDAWLGDHGFARDPAAHWLEVYDRRTHHWEDKSSPENEIWVYMPVAPASDEEAFPNTEPRG